MTERSQKRIGELLIERGLINARQLEQALSRQRVTGQFLGSILVEARLITEEELIKTISRQFGIAYEALDPMTIDWDITKSFPPSLLSAGKGFPIRADAHTVTVAMFDPFDVWTLSAYERVSRNRAILPVLTLEHELLLVVRIFRRRVLEELEAKLNGGSDG